MITTLIYLVDSTLLMPHCITICFSSLYPFRKNESKEKRLTVVDTLPEACRNLRNSGWLHPEPWGAWCIDISTSTGFLFFSPACACVLRRQTYHEASFPRSQSSAAETSAWRCSCLFFCNFYLLIASPLALLEHIRYHPDHQNLWFFKN